MSYNHVVLLGNLTRDCEVRFTPNGKAVCKVGIAVNEKWRDSTGQDRESVLFIDATIFDKRGEAFAKFHRKGDMAFIAGKLQLEQWDDKSTGAKRSRHSILVSDWSFTGKPGQRESAPAYTSSAQSEASAPPMSCDDTPF